MLEEINKIQEDLNLKSLGITPTTNDIKLDRAEIVKSIWFKKL